MTREVRIPRVFESSGLWGISSNRGGRVRKVTCLRSRCRSFGRKRRPDESCRHSPEGFTRSSERDVLLTLWIITFKLVWKRSFQICVTYFHPFILGIIRNTCLVWTVLNLIIVLNVTYLLFVCDFENQLWPSYLSLYRIEMIQRSHSCFIFCSICS